MGNVTLKHSSMAHIKNPYTVLGIYLHARRYKSHFAWLRVHVICLFSINHTRGWFGVTIAPHPVHDGRAD